jgi:hypothetical protein
MSKCGLPQSPAVEGDEFGSTKNWIEVLFETRA